MLLTSVAELRVVFQIRPRENVKIGREVRLNSNR